MEVREGDAEDAVEVLRQDYLKTTALASHDLSTAGAVFDAEAGATVCPGCGKTFAPTETVCPECGLSFG